MSPALRCCTTALSLIALSAAATAQDWPQFLGRDGTGVSHETDIAQSWPKAGPPVLWEKRVGTGYSAPSVLGDHLVVHHREGDEEVVQCLNASAGEELWRVGYPSDFSDPYGYNNGPRCTPLLAENRCYTYGANGKLLCVDLESGKEIWSRDTLKDYQVPEGFFGVGCTPILEGDLLITLVGGQPNSGVVAFNKDTGKTVWESVGKDTWNGVTTTERGAKPYEWTGDEMSVSYSSPIPATIHGQRHVFCLMRQGLVSLDPADGSVRFAYWFRSTLHESVNAARPVVVGDKVFISAAYRVGSALLQIGEDGKSFSEVWRDANNMQNHWSTSIHAGGHLYGFSGRHEQEATLRCLDLETGKVEWETTGFEGDPSSVKQDRLTGKLTDANTGEEIPWPYYGRGSKIQVGDKFIVLGERGTLALVHVNPERIEEIARTSYKQISYPSWTAPVLSRGRLYLRDEDALLCLDVSPGIVSP